MDGSKKANFACILSILLSFLIHATSYRLIERIPSTNLEQPQNEAIEIEVLSPKKISRNKPQNFIKDFDLNKQIENTKKKALYLSRKTRRVKKETIASKSGLTKNRIPQKKIIPLKKLLAKRKGLPGKAPKTKTPLSAFFGSNINRQPINSSINLTQQKSESTISTHIPNVEKASITAIDTDQGLLRFYTFYMRLHDQLYPRWSNNLNEVINMLPTKKYKYLSKRDRVTSLEVILNAKGEYVGHIVVKSSASKLIDFAAVDAFKRASPFANPPKDMVEDDGLIYLPFNFRLVLSSRLFARDR